MGNSTQQLDLCWKGLFSMHSNSKFAAYIEVSLTIRLSAGPNFAFSCDGPQCNILIRHPLLWGVLSWRRSMIARMTTTHADFMTFSKTNRRLSIDNGLGFLPYGSVQLFTISQWRWRSFKVNGSRFTLPIYKYFTLTCNRYYGASLSIFCFIC